MDTQPEPGWTAAVGGFQLFAVRSAAPPVPGAGRAGRGGCGGGDGGSPPPPAVAAS